MATYNVPSGIFSYSQTLTADAADTVQFADRAGYVSVANLGTSPVWVRADGQAAVAGAEDNYVVLPNEMRVLANALPTWFPSSRVLVQGDDNANGESKVGGMANPGTQVSLISAGAESYVVAFAA